VAEKFIKIINNDLDTPQALAVVWDLIKSDYPEDKKMATLLEFDKVLGLGLEQNKKNTPKGSRGNKRAI